MFSVGVYLSSERKSLNGLSFSNIVLGLPKKSDLKKYFASQSENSYGFNETIKIKCYFKKLVSTCIISIKHKKGIAFYGNTFDNVFFMKKFCLYVVLTTNYHGVTKYIMSFIFK